MDIKAVTKVQQIATFGQLFGSGLDEGRPGIHFCQRLRIIPNSFAAPAMKLVKAVKTLRVDGELKHLLG